MNQIIAYLKSLHPFYFLLPQSHAPNNHLHRHPHLLHISCNLQNTRLSPCLQALLQTLHTSRFHTLFPPLRLRRVYHVRQVPVNLQTLLVLHTLLRGEAGYLCRLKQSLENPLLRRRRAIQQPRQVAQNKHPLVKHRLQLILSFTELGHLQVNERQLVVEQLTCLPVHQPHFVMIILIAIRILVKNKIQHPYRVNRLQLEIPISMPRLLSDREGRVIHAYGP